VKNKKFWIIILTIFAIVFTSIASALLFINKYSVEIKDFNIEKNFFLEVKCDLFKKYCSQEINIYLKNYYEFEDNLYLQAEVFTPKQEKSYEITLPRNLFDDESLTLLKTYGLYKFGVITDLEGNINKIIVKDLKEEISKTNLLSNIVSNNVDINEEIGTLPISYVDKNSNEEYVTLNPEYSNTCVYRIRALEFLTKDKQILQSEFEDCREAINTEENNISLFKLENQYYLESFAKSNSFEDIIIPNFESESLPEIKKTTETIDTQDITINETENNNSLVSGVLYSQKIQKEEITKLSDLAYFCLNNKEACDLIDPYYNYLKKSFLENRIPSDIYNVSLLTASLIDVRTLSSTNKYDKDLDYLVGLLMANNLSNTFSTETNLLINRLANIFSQYELLKNNLSYKSFYIYNESISIDKPIPSKIQGIFINNVFSELSNITNILNLSL
jgi:hypothetical protein